MAERLLVLRPGAIGDTLLTLPALLALRRWFPTATIEVAGNATALPLVAASGTIDRWLSFDDPRITRLFVPRPPAGDDAFLGLNVAVAWCADPDGALRQALAARGARQLVMQSSRPAPGQTVHVARHLLETLQPVGIEAGTLLDVPDLPLPAAAESEARRELSAAGLEGVPFVAIHPGSGSAAKNWPAERFGAVVDGLARQHGRRCLILGGPADSAVLGRLEAGARGPVPVLVSRPLIVVAAILRHAHAFLGNDSGLAHLAGLLGVPTLALFGPTDPSLWLPLGPRVRALRWEPLAELPVDRVLAALTMLPTR